eukprot:1618569-Prymnesium_polylepis.1
MCLRSRSSPDPGELSTARSTQNGRSSHTNTWGQSRSYEVRVAYGCIGQASPNYETTKQQSWGLDRLSL